MKFIVGGVYFKYGQNIYVLQIYVIILKSELFRNMFRG